MGRNGNGNNTHYASLNRSDVPQGRKGKHRKVVADILDDLSKLNAQQAVRVPLSSLNGEKMQNLRSALNRVTRERNIPVETSSERNICIFGAAMRPRVLERTNNRLEHHKSSNAKLWRSATKFQAQSIVQNDVEQRTVDLQSAFDPAGVVNKTQFPEPVHEKAYS
jgi:hypothetical protein